MTRPEPPAELVSDAVDVLEDIAHEGCEPGISCVGYTRERHTEIAREVLAAVLPVYLEQLAEAAAGLVVEGPSGWGLHCGPCDRTLIACSDGDFRAAGIVTAILRHAVKPEHIANTITQENQ